MIPRRLVAVQFAIWTIAFSSVIPLASFFMGPIIWILDRRICLVVWIVSYWEGLPIYIGAIHAIPNFEKYTPAWALPFVLLGGCVIFLVIQIPDIAFSAYFLKRKMWKKNPNVMVILEGKRPP